MRLPTIAILIILAGSIANAETKTYEVHSLSGVYLGKRVCLSSDPTNCNTYDSSGRTVSRSRKKGYHVVTCDPPSTCREQ